MEQHTSSVVFEVVELRVNEVYVARHVAWVEAAHTEEEEDLWCQDDASIDSVVGKPDEYWVVVVDMLHV